MKATFVFMPAIIEVEINGVLTDDPNVLRQLASKEAGKQYSAQGNIRATSSQTALQKLKEEMKTKVDELSAPPINADAQK